MTLEGAKTREHIIRQAAELFNRLGYAGASMNDIMRATGLKKGGIYNHFESKEQLALEAFEYAYHLVTDYFTQSLQNRKNAVERLFLILELFKAYAEKPILAGGCPILNTAIEADDTNPPLKALVREAMSELHELIYRICEKGVERGQLAATIFLATLEGAVLLTHLNDDLRPMLHAVDHLTDYIHTRLAPHPTLS
jgi:AcrR family transcriptional regulator